MRKVCEVYEALEPWMIGKKVEVGVYGKNEDGDTDDWKKSCAGRLESYLSTAQRATIKLTGWDVALTVDHEFETYLVTVPVFPDKVPRSL